jgi:hypothetical protein
MSMLTSNTGAFIEGQQYGKKKRKKPMACGKKHSYKKTKTPVKRKK